MRPLVLFVLAFALSGCVVMCSQKPKTKTDRVWYNGFRAAQEAGGTCTTQTCRYRDFLHEVVGVEYANMRLISSRDVQFENILHLRLQVRHKYERRTYDPQVGAFHYKEGELGCVYARQVTRMIFPGDYKPVEPGGLYDRKALSE